MKQEDLTIIIPTLYTELSSRGLHYCLDSLKDFEGKIIIAINGGKQVDLQNKRPNVSIDVRKEQGQCGATNQAVKRADTEWIMISNDDMVYPKGWFEKFTYPVDNFGLQVASPNLVEPQKGAPPFLLKYCGGLGTIGTEPNFDLFAFEEFAQNHKEHENRPDTMLEDGFNLPFIVKREVWDTVGGYDEDYDPWGSNSDSDLQYKFILAGVKPKRIRNALVYHFANTSGTFHPDHKGAWDNNWQRFIDKWGIQRASSPSIWYEPEVDWTQNIYHPAWENTYGD